MPLFPFLLILARSFFVPRVELMAEILALRQQLAILNRTTKRPSLRFRDRLFWIALARRPPSTWIWTKPCWTIEFKAPQLASNDEAGQKQAIAERADRVRRAKYHWGNDWLILPNLVYGEWQRLCGDNPRGKLKVTAMKQVRQFNAIH